MTTWSVRSFPQTDMLVSSDATGFVFVWNYTTGTVMKSIKVSSTNINSLSVIPGTTYLIEGGD